MLSPILVLVALAVKFTSPGPVLFRQVRSGWGGRPFVIYKFRTMVVDAGSRKAALLAMNEGDGPAFKIKCDPRSAIGRLPLHQPGRAAAAVEHPGRRHDPGWSPASALCRGGRLCRLAAARLDVTPGLTCIWQVARPGRRDLRRLDAHGPGVFRKRSLWHDLKLLLWTIPAVLLRRGAH